MSHDFEPVEIEIVGPDLTDAELFAVKPLRRAVLAALQEIGAQWRRDRITEQYLAAA